MKILLTSNGISNGSIHNALVKLLGKLIAGRGALCVPTGIYPFSEGPVSAYQFITSNTASPVCGLGWKSLGVLERTALPSVRRERWVPLL